MQDLNGFRRGFWTFQLVLLGLGLGAILNGCNRSDTVPGPTLASESSGEAPATPVLPPMEPDALHQRLQEDAGKTAQTPEQLREDTIKNEILFDYTGIVSTLGQAEAYVDPATNRLCWRAFTCTYPKCTGKGKDGNPFLFAYRTPGVIVGANGQVDWTVPNSIPSQETRLAGVCPACFKVNVVRPYHPADELQKREAMTRKINGKSAEIDTFLNRNEKPPRELWDELDKMRAQQSELPTYYLRE